MTSPPDFGIIGDAPTIRDLRERIALIGPSSLPVLILGPTGAGKELVAQGVHAASGRRGSCVAFNVCALSEGILEAALFGHVRGAFTGAVADAPGYLTEADGGTAFLDEVGALSPALQPKLLRAIDTRRYRPVGGRKDSTSEFRVVAATNEDLERLVAADAFRADLLYRLRGAVLRVPPLAQRVDDIPLLARHFLRACATEKELTDDAVVFLQERDWPGNVRQLRYVVEHAAVITNGMWIGRSGVSAALGADAGLTARFERRRLVEVLEDVGWDTAAAARAMGVHRATVYRRMGRAGIQPPRSLPGLEFASIRANSRRPRANGANWTAAEEA